MSISRISVAGTKVVLGSILFFLSFISFGMQECILASGITAVRLLDGVGIESSTIFLRDIADITGGNPSLIKKIESIEIGRAPLPGKSRQIDRGYLNIRLKQNNIDLSQVNFEGNDRIEVKRSFVEIDKERIKDIVLDYIYKNNPWEKERLTVRTVNVKDNVILSKGKMSYRVINQKGKDFLGTLLLSVIFEVNGEEQKKIFVTADIDVLTEVVVANRPIKRRKLITENDVRLQEMDLADLSSNTIMNLEEVLGKRTKREISPNLVLRTDLIEFPPLIKRGDVVLMIAESDCIRITSIGKAQEEGLRGERIKVENLNSRKQIYAEIIDHNTVKVAF